MTPVNQSIVDKSRGDCQRAALASLLDLELEQVPHFRLFGDGEWINVFNGFIWSVGYEWNGSADLARHKSPANYDHVDGYVMAVVPSKTYADCENITHAVILDLAGNVVHDPHPSKAWQGVNVVESADLVYWYLIQRRKD
jgi:hypothetical protein